MSCEPVPFETVVEEEFKHIGLDASFGEAHTMGPAEAPKALCLSGGGIRSATFALGVLQGLAKRELLGQFDYLSTVSGGGYIGAWLSAWLQRDGQGKVLSDLGKPEPAPVRYLRQYSNYLSPRLGLLSADTWTLAAIFLRNLVLNWAILLPTLAAAMLVPYLSVAFLVGGDPGSAAVQTWAWTGVAAGLVFAVISIAHLPLWLPGVAGQTRLTSEAGFVVRHLVPLGVACVALTTSWFYLWPAGWSGGWFWFVLGGAALQELGWVAGAAWAGRPLPWPARVLILAIGALAGWGAWGLASGVLGPWAIQRRPCLYVVCALPLVLGLLVAANFLSVAAGSRERWKSRFGDEDREWWARASAWLLIVAVVWLGFSAIVLFGPRALNAINRWVGGAAAQWYVSVGGTLSGALAALIGWSSKTSWIFEKGGSKGGRMVVGLAEKLLAPVFVVCLLAVLSLWASPLLGSLPWPWIALWIVILFAAGWLCGRALSVNRFSLHAMYRSRLIRAYLGASRERHPDPFTGFEKEDNLLMTDLRTPVKRPLHILNLTLNITTGEELAWQQRKAQSFTVSCLHVGYGGPGDGPAYQPAERYTDQGGISLGTAMTVSGAAASPNMGYHSSRVLAFLMALFNARLGAWLPNPRCSDERTLGAGGPDSPFFLWKEALGMASAKERWVYLSDGGHFDNLGLYEMVRRHAKLVVVSDAGADPQYTFGDLTEAIRKIRTDMGVPLEFVKPPVLRPKSAGPSHHCALLRIRYSHVRQHEPDGLLLYIKPALCGQEAAKSRDVASYSAKHANFPQQPTSDQFFSEAQFESYRRLGEQSIEEITAGWPGRDLPSLFRYVEDNYLAKPPE